MSDVYVYQGALYCEECGEAIRARLAATAPEDPNDDSSFDSNDYPKGPYPDGGGEADTAQYCDACHCALDNSAIEGDDNGS